MNTTNRRGWQCLSFAQLSAVVAVVLAVVMGPVTMLAQGKAGDRKKFPIGNGLTVNFRLCPSGTMQPGNPDENLARVDVEEFWIMETELSHGEFAALLGETRWEEVVIRVDPLNYLKEDIPEYLSNKAFPVFGVSLREAVEVCRKINERTARSASPGLVTEQVRLPSWYEWQYACRAGQEAMRHFHGWRSDKVEKTVLEICKEEWAELKKEEEFTGTQSQVVMLLENLLSGEDQESSPDNRNNAEEVLYGFLKAGLSLKNGFGSDSADNEREEGVPAIKCLEKCGSTAHFENPWHIRFMHGNISEWAIETSKQVAIADVWSDLQFEPDEQSEADRKRLDSYSAVWCGGSFHITDVTQWKRFTIWGGNEPLSFKKALQKPEDNEYPGIRLVLSRSLSEDWLHLVRVFVNKLESETPAEETARRFGQYEQSLKESSGVAKRDANLASLDFYRALAIEKSSDAYGQFLKKAASSPAVASDPYFRLLQLGIDDTPVE